MNPSALWCFEIILRIQHVPVDKPDMVHLYMGRHGLDIIKTGYFVHLHLHQSLLQTSSIRGLARLSCVVGWLNDKDGCKSTTSLSANVGLCVHSLTFAASL